ncbi:MAG: glycosyltransferase family 2 protein [Clostridia bacterium]|nr:glycosyltransferase family 2 protein [Clostridia bacterium]
MPSYNCGDFIAESIRSVLGQTYENVELIVSDDHSTDNTQEVVGSFDDERLIYIRSEKNMGASYARNAALEKAHGAFYAFLDSDDVWHPDKLEKQIAFMEKTGADFSCTAYRKIDESGNPLGITITPYEKADYNRELYAGNPVGNSTAMYSAEKFGDVRIPIIRSRNDFALWLSILKRTDYVYGCPEVLVDYRVRSGSVSSNKFKLIRSHWYLYRKIEKLNVFKSAAAMCGWVIVKGLKLREKKTL